MAGWRWLFIIGKLPDYKKPTLNLTCLQMASSLYLLLLLDFSSSLGYQAVRNLGGLRQLSMIWLGVEWLQLALNPAKK
jgi:hypothetical protein